MKKVIMVEGPDGGGKSTLISKIHRDGVDNGDLIFHNGLYPTPDDAYSSYLGQLNAFEEGACDRLILDRSVISQMIYGAVMRNEPLNYEMTDKIQAKFLQLNGIIILCLPPLKVCMQNWRARNAQNKEYVTKSKKMIQIYGLYSAVSEAFNLIKYDYTTDEVPNELYR